MAVRRNKAGGARISGYRGGRIRRSTFAVLVLLSLLYSFGDVVHAGERPEIIRLDAEYTESLVKINVHWQSSNPVTFIRAIVGKEVKELKIDEYENRRIRDGYAGEAIIVVTATPAATADGIPYIVQIEDDIRLKSEQVTGKVKTSAGTGGVGAAPSTDGAGNGKDTWSASGEWSASGTGPIPGNIPMDGIGQGGKESPSGGSAQGGRSGGGHPDGRGGTRGGSAPSGDAWSKARKGRPGELIDKTIGLIAGDEKGTGVSEGAPEESPLPAGKKGGDSRQTLQNEKFDPGGKALFVSDLNPDDEVAVVLGPVDRRFTVTKVLFLLGGSSGKSTVTVRVSRGSVPVENPEILFTASIEVQGLETALQEIDLAKAGGVVPVPAGSVCVSIQVQHAGLPGIGYDTSANAVPGRNWIRRSGIWSDFGAAGIQGNGIIRATVVQ